LATFLRLALKRMRAIAESILGSAPSRAVFSRVERLPVGRRVLNSVSGQRGVFGSFDEACVAARRTGLAGHEDPSLVALHLELARSLRPSDYAALFWIMAIGGGQFRLFDFGGNAGNLFYSYSPYLEQLGTVQWTVYDLPAVVEQGRRIAEERKAGRLRFTTSLSDFSGDQVLLVSGAFHYWERTVSEFVEQFPAHPEHVIINRTPVHKTSRTFVTVQRTPKCAVPCVVRNDTELTSGFESAGYGLIDRWDALELQLKPPLFPDRWVPHYSGFYFRRRCVD
jgi:putative methyltransferase (TIGR04325 family)